jgi:hypothetical protein
MLTFPEKNCALVIAHPGHELRLFGWLTSARPLVFVLTDGSGHSGESRLHRTTEILNNAGARPGSIYGRVTDGEVYQAILQSNVDFFLQMTNELVSALIAEKIALVVGDAIEGYNPVHDVCRLLINRAVRIARAQNHSIENYDVVLTDGVADLQAADDVTINLDAQTFSLKINTASNYPAIAADFAAIVEKEGLASLKTEHLRRVLDDSGSYRFVSRPSYELHGEKQVAAGYYEQVLRYREHMLPLAEALQGLG